MPAPPPSSKVSEARSRVWGAGGHAHRSASPPVRRSPRQQLRRRLPSSSSHPRSSPSFLRGPGTLPPLATPAFTPHPTRHPTPTASSQRDERRRSSRKPTRQPDWLLSPARGWPGCAEQCPVCSGPAFAASPVHRPATRSHPNRTMPSTRTGGTVGERAHRHLPTRPRCLERSRRIYK